MLETDSPDVVLRALRATTACRIGIDGSDGSGKSTLAKGLAAALGCRLISLDEYLDRNKFGFLDFIDYPRLRAEVAESTQCVIEGVCLLEVLQRAGLGIDSLVYVKRRQLGYWADESELDIQEPLEDFLQKERELAAMVAGESEPGDDDLGLAEEIIRYHYATRPHNKADIIYFRDD